jgi:beta-lactamase superfamily II metal-dependent hydrolase
MSLNRSPGIDFGQAPLANEIEVAVIGPGYGECICIHVGSGRWMIVDCCIETESKIPWPEYYLNSLGVSMKEQVDLIVASHWHDDHARGLSRCLDICSHALFCVSSVLTTNEFIEFTKRHETNPTSLAGSRLSEINKVFDILAYRSRNPRDFRHSTARRATQGKLLFSWPPSAIAHKETCQVISLSPSDFADEDFLKRIVHLMPGVGKGKHSAPLASPNDTSVALWVSVGQTNILLGSDLENGNKNPEKGWNAILNANNCPTGLANIFKIPHHGSENGHHPEVWNRLIHHEAITVSTPWIKGGRNIPTSNDILRISELRQNNYLTSRSSSTKSRYTQTVQKALREISPNATPLSLKGKAGLVRLRKSMNESSDPWRCEIFGDAYAI